MMCCCVSSNLLGGDMCRPSGGLTLSESSLIFSICTNDTMSGEEGKKLVFFSDMTGVSRAQEERIDDKFKATEG